MKIWEIKKDKVWTTPEVSITVEGKTSVMPLTDVLKKYKNIVELVSGMASGIDSSFHVYVNGNEISQEEDVLMSWIRSVVVSTKPIERVKSTTLREKMKEEGILETDVPVVDEKKPITKNHQHAGIVGYHKKTDSHKNPVAQRAHNKAMKEEAK